MKTINFAFKGDTLVLAEPWKINDFGHITEKACKRRYKFMRIVDPAWEDPPSYYDDRTNYRKLYDDWRNKFDESKYSFTFFVGTAFRISSLDKTHATLKVKLADKKITLRLPIVWLNGMVVES